MKAFLIIALLGLPLAAQDRYRDYDRYDYDRYRGDDRYYQARDPFDRLLADLDRAESSGYYRGNDRRRFQDVRHDVFEFRQRASRGRYDRHELDEMIGRVQKLVDKTPLNPRDREILWDDLAMLRDFRARNGYEDRYYRR
jgi:hypothetical protein